MSIAAQGATAQTGILPFVHPGEPLSDRMSYVDVEIAPVRRLVVERGEDLYNVINDFLDQNDASGCAFTLVAGTVADLEIMTGGAGENGEGMTFYGPHALNGPYAVKAGAGSTGVTIDGQRFTHCHAVFEAPGGELVGGHLISGGTIAGADGITVDLTVVSQGRFARRTDPETLFDIFHPEGQ